MNNLAELHRLRFAGAWLVLAALGLRLANAATSTPAEPANRELTVSSPDGTIEVSVQADGRLTYSISVDGRPVIDEARLGLKLREGTTFGTDVEPLSSAHQSEDATWENPLGKRRYVRNQYREMSLLLGERSAKDRTFQLIFRVFDDGVAFRYVLLSQPGLRDFVLNEEITEFRFPADYACYAGQHEGDKKFVGPQEWEFRRRQLSEIPPVEVIGLPVVVQTPAAWVAIAEADLLNWGGMWVGGAGGGPNPRG